MKQILGLFKWLLKAAVFFTLFAFALNNQSDVTVYFFFGTRWTAPLVIVVLSAFAIGLLIGVLGMVPRWWQQRKAAVVAHKKALLVQPPTEPLLQVPPHGL